MSSCNVTRQIAVSEMCSRVDHRQPSGDTVNGRRPTDRARVMVLPGVERCNVCISFSPSCSMIYLMRRQIHHSRRCLSFTSPSALDPAAHMCTVVTTRLSEAGTIERIGQISVRSFQLPSPSHSAWSVAQRVDPGARKLPTDSSLVECSFPQRQLDHNFSVNKAVSRMPPVIPRATIATVFNKAVLMLRNVCPFLSLAP